MLVRMEEPDKGILVPLDPFESGDAKLSIAGDDHHDHKAFMTKQFLHPAKIEFAEPKAEATYFEDKLIKAMVDVADNVGTQMIGWGDRKDQLSARKRLISARVRTVLKEMDHISIMKEHTT